MGVQQVAIVGRPNVGKSSLFNWIVGRRVAIVDGEAGITRDRLIQLTSRDDRYFEVIDTGGMGLESEDDLTSHVEEQINVAIDSADVILFVVDTRAGVLPLDVEVARRLRYVDVPVICVANKTDDQKFDSQADEFYRLGRGKLIRVSVHQNRGRDELLQMILDRLPESDPDADEIREPTMKVAIVGRRNVGKSTFVNALANAQRMITSEIPGTTRDSVDVRFEMDGQAFVAIDTPGLKRRKAISSNVDFYGLHRAQRSIRHADVVFMFFDASQRISKVEKQLCNYVDENYKPCFFVVNKWDLYAKDMPTERWATYLRETFRTMWHVPIAFITAQTGKNVKALINHGQMLFKQSRTRVGTGELNRLLRAALEHNPPPRHHGRRPKIFYATQVAVQPPTIVLFCSRTDAFDQTYQRYLLGVFRDRLPFGEVPIKLYLRRRRNDSPGGSRGSEDELIDIDPSDSDVQESTKA